MRLSIRSYLKDRAQSLILQQFSKMKVKNSNINLKELIVILLEKVEHFKDKNYFQLRTRILGNQNIIVEVELETFIIL